MIKNLISFINPNFEDEQKEYKSKDGEQNYTYFTCKMLNHWYKRDYRLSENQSVYKMLNMLQNDFLPHKVLVLIVKQNLFVR